MSALEIMEGTARHLANQALIGKSALMPGMEGILGEEVEILPVTVEYLVNGTAQYSTGGMGE